MAKKQEISEQVKAIRKALEDNTAIVGAERTIKLLKQGKVKQVFLAMNCAPETKADIEKYAKLADVPIEKLKYANDELGTLCKRQHFISVLSIGA